MKKVLLFISLLFLLSGCNIQCDIAVQNDNKLVERVSIREDNDLILVNNDSLELFLTDKQKESTQLFTGYKVDKFVGSTMSGLNITRNGQDWHSFRRDSLFGTLYKDAYYLLEDDIVTFYTTTDNYSEVWPAEQLDSSFNVDKIAINIKIPFKVISHNATSVKGDTYTWILTEDNRPEQIKFSYKYVVKQIEKKDPEKKVINGPDYIKMGQKIKNNFKAIIMMTLIILCGSFAIYIVYQYIKIKNKQNNRL